MARRQDEVSCNGKQGEICKQEDERISTGSWEVLRWRCLEQKGGRKVPRHKLSWRVTAKQGERPSRQGHQSGKEGQGQMSDTESEKCREKPSDD